MDGPYVGTGLICGHFFLYSIQLCVHCVVIINNNNKVNTTRTEYRTNRTKNKNKIGIKLKNNYY